MREPSPYRVHATRASFGAVAPVCLAFTASAVRLCIALVYDFVKWAGLDDTLTSLLLDAKVVSGMAARSDFGVAVRSCSSVVR